MNRINLIWEKRNEYWDETNNRFHNRLQICCMVVIVLMFAFLFIYG